MKFGILKRIRQRATVLLIVIAAMSVCLRMQAQNVAALTGGPIGNPTMDVYFLDVNQGNCTLIKLPSGNFILYDAGTTSSATNPQTVAAKITQITGGANIATIFLSHPDKDHISLIPYIAEAKSPTYLHISGDITAYNKLLGTWLAALPATTDTVTYPTNTSQLAPTTKVVDNSGVKVYIMAANVAGDPNTQSIVLNIEYKGITILLTGDATATTERWILAQWPANSISANLLAFGHHGSNHSSSSLFLNTVQPDVGIFSASAAHMGYGHPRCSIIDLVEKMVDSTTKNGKTIPMHRIDCWDGSQYVTEQNDIGIFLTATQGNILFRHDGTNYAVYVDRL